MKEVILGPFRESCAEIYRENSKYGVRFKWDYFGNSFPIPCLYESYRIVSGYSIALKRNGKWGIVSYRNEVLCDFIYDRIEKSPEWTNLCMAMKNGRWGLIISGTGSIACGFNYDQIKPIKIKTKARRKLPGESYNDDSRYSQYYWLLYAGGKVFPYDDNANMIYPRGFDNVYNIVQYGPRDKDVCFIVETNFKKGLLRTDGQLICRCEFDEIKPIEGYNIHDKSFFCLVIVKQNNLWGLLGNNGEQVLDCEFEEIKSVGSAIALKHENKWGILPLQQVLKIVVHI